jgi:hypothetical protein
MDTSALPTAFALKEYYDLMETTAQLIRPCDGSMDSFKKCLSLLDPPDPPNPPDLL